MPEKQGEWFFLTPRTSRGLIETANRLTPIIDVSSEVP